MKITSLPQRRLFAAAPALALLLGGVIPARAATLQDPTGDWEFYFAGEQRGVAQITFEADFTITGIHIHLPGHPDKAEVNPRGGTFDPEDPRGSDTSTNAIVLYYGGAVIEGGWGYTSKGRPVGAMTLRSSSRTNGMSFSGTVSRNGARMTFSATREGQRSVYHGVRRAVLPDISSRYLLTGKRGREFFSETLELTPSGFPNMYDLTKTGPGYTGDGFAILTGNKRLGVYTEHFKPGTTNVVITAHSGKFNTNKLSGKLIGFDGDSRYSLNIGSFQPAP
jgi:hypothetical protein